MTTTQECSKCGCSNRGCLIGGCFWDTATEEQLDKVIEEGLKHPNWRPTTAIVARLFGRVTTREHKLILAVLIDDVIKDLSADADSDSEDEE